MKNIKLNVSIIKEENQLGTGGAIANFLNVTNNNVSFIVINGDTFFRYI